MSSGRELGVVGWAAAGIWALVAHGAFAAVARILPPAPLTRTEEIFEIALEEPVEKEPPAREPPPEPEPSEPEPDPRPELAPKQTSAPETPPAAAQAAQVMTQEPDSNEPLDLTDNTFVTGNADRYAGGTTATRGTSAKAVRDPRAGNDGKRHGSAPLAKAESTRSALDRSAPAMPLGGTNWSSCGFPPEGCGWLMEPITRPRSAPRRWRCRYVKSAPRSAGDDHSGVSLAA